MATSVKINQLGAFQLEAGQAGAGLSPGWGQSGSEEALGANDAFPWTSFGKGKTINSERPNEITSEAYPDIPQKVGEYVDKSISLYPRFYSSKFGSMLYWMWGFENSIVKVGVFTLTTPSVEPVAGATYRDTDTNDFTFMRKETWGTTIYYIFRCDDSAVPTLATGNLTKQAGTGDATLTFSARSALMYEHLFELDAHERHLVDYRTAEQITGWGAGDKKNRMATLGIKLGTNDYRYKNAMCKGFSLKSSAGSFTELSADFIAYDEDRGDYSSANWTFDSGFNVSDSIIAHHNWLMQVGASATTLVDLGVTSFDLGVSIPLQVIQDTVSSTHIAEPVFEGKYGITCGMVISRHTVDTYQDYRDAWTSVVARMAARSGYYMQEFLVNETKITEAGPDDGEVPTNALKLDVGYSSTNNWSTWLYGNTLIQSGPVVLRWRNDDSTNHMFEI